MAEELVMPRLSDTMERGTVARWLKHEGDRVAAGDIVAEIETDKATMDYQSDLDGVLLRILVADGESADLGAPIALVGEEGEEPPAASSNGAAAEAESEQAPEAQDEPETVEAKPQAEAEPAEARARPEPEPRTAPAQSAGAAELKASPVARRLAGEAGVDLRPLAGKGSGPEGRIVRVDVERLIEGGAEAAPAATPAAPKPAPAPAPAARYEDGEVVEPSAMLKAVARRMAEAKSTVPHFYLNAEIDMTRAVQMRTDLNGALEGTGEKISFNDLVIVAVAKALVEHTDFHRSWVDGKLVYHQHAHVGIAVALDEGLIVPVLRDADTKGVREIAREARDLAGRAREGKLKQNEIEGGTFSVSNLGMFGITSFDAVINPPEPGILAVGAIVERPVVRDGEVVVRPIMGVTLSIDHRAASGADGARFLGTVVKLLESGVLLLA